MTKPKDPEIPSTLGDLPGDPDNPRTISKEKAEGLAYSLDEFGDLSGITFNLQTKHLVCGHQRVDQLFQKYGPMVIQGVDEHFGYMKTPAGERFNIRFVDWPIEKQRAANIAANSTTIQGEFDDVLLRQSLDFVRADSKDVFDSLLLSDLYEVETNSGDGGKLVDVEVLPPPKMTWVLVGIPTVRYGEINGLVEELAKIKEATISTTSNNG